MAGHEGKTPPLLKKQNAADKQKHFAQTTNRLQKKN